MFPSRYFPDVYFAQRYWPKVGAVSTIAADIYEAIYDLLADTDALTVSFGRADWLYIDVGPVDEVIPYAILAHLTDDVEAQPAYGNSLPHTVNRTFEIRVFDDDRTTARTLGEAVATAIEAGRTDLTNDEATVIDCVRTGDQGDELDPDTGPAGEDVWSYRVEFVAMLART